MVLSCAALNSYEPMRLAGTWKQYSKKAMPQLARMTFQSASLRFFRWPYHAKVINIFEIVSKRIVRISRCPVIRYCRASRDYVARTVGECSWQLRMSRLWNKAHRDRSVDYL